MFEISDNLKSLPPYLFVEIDKAKRKARAEGRDVIDFGIGDPDQPTPEYIIDELCRAARDPANHRYALDQGIPLLREAICAWYKERFSVGIDPEKEVLPLIGSKEGISHFPFAFLNNGDYSLVPDPCYPPYKGGTILAGGRVHLLPLKEENSFLPDLKGIPSSVLGKARIIYLNYPNNPTGRAADKGFFAEAVAFALKYGLILVSDLAYSEMAYDGYKPVSMLEVEGAKDCVIEFHSLSKTCNMTGWRVGWACGNPLLVSALAKVKSNIDSGIFTALQYAGAAALKNSGAQSAKMSALYQERRDILVEGLRKLGWDVYSPKATFYLWFKVPDKQKNSMEFAAYLLEKADIIVTPGVGFGVNGEGYLRMALTVSVGRIKEALKRMEKLS
ncbi:MAG: LL-diaminopimelate aminotransferase [Candidatus Omnitrophota bacterium]|jgi:LL-diaminopimelate aminotransferase